MHTQQRSVPKAFESYMSSTWFAGGVRIQTGAEPVGMGRFRPSECCICCTFLAVNKLPRFWVRIRTVASLLFVPYKAFCTEKVPRLPDRRTVHCREVSHCFPPKRLFSTLERLSPSKACFLPPKRAFFHQSWLSPTKAHCSLLKPLFPAGYWKLLVSL